MYMNKKNSPKIVCIGGGTGTFVALKGLKKYPCQLHAIVTMSDSGGSNKRIRDEFGLLPTSDIRQCLVALSDENGGVGLLRKLFMYRFEKGKGLSGMTFGNLFMAALSDILGSQEEAIRQTGRVLRIQGTVVPVSFTDTNLFAQYEDGHIVTEEHLIDEPTHDGRMRITKVYLKPSAMANPEAIRTINDADSIVLGPGDLYTSLLPNLLVEGIPEAIRTSKAKKVYVVNLMTKYGQTYNFSARDHVNVIQEFIGNSLDYVIINNASIPSIALKIYEKSHEQQVFDDLHDTKAFKVIRANLVGRQFTKPAKSDTLVRSLIRHDSDSLAKVLISL
jgi:uncharacterized cofD-like protein